MATSTCTHALCSAPTIVGAQSCAQCAYVAEVSAHRTAVLALGLPMWTTEDVAWQISFHDDRLGG